MYSYLHLLYLFLFVLMLLILQPHFVFYPFDLITMLKARRKARIAVAGGISSQTVKDYALLGPDVVIVGSAITHAADPADEARKISQVLLQYH